MRRTIVATAVISTLLLFQASAGTQTAKRPFDESADAPAAIEAALADALRENQRVLIHWGTDSADGTAALREFFKENRQIARKLLYEYRVVNVDLGESADNLELVEQYGVGLTGAADELPHLTVLDADGDVVANRPAAALAEGGQYDAQKILDFLSEHQAAYLSADAVLAAALAEAGRVDKRVFLHSGAPWCGWCKRLEAWMARPQVSQILTKDFVPVKIDVDRMLGGKSIGDRYVEGYGGVPWIVILDPDGALVADSFNEEGRNIGSPYYDWEIEYFGVMLNEVVRNISEDEIEALLESLVAAREGSQ